MNNACETAVIDRHVALCCGWARMAETFGKPPAVPAEDTAIARFRLAEFRHDTPLLAAAVRAKGVG